MTKSVYTLTLSLIIFVIFNCSPYASEEEIQQLKEKRNQIRILEKEVKELKQKQLELMKEKFTLLREIENCKKESKQIDTTSYSQ
ncbi:MAG: hypothetical protein N3F03_04335 [Ignavibacteria bacterium]|nr:hypothetical protein [Ignavibacteria bacterium]